MLDDNCFPLTTVVAVDRDKNSQQAVKWAVDNFLIHTPIIVLVHVRTTTSATPRSGGTDGGSGAGRDSIDDEMAEMFRSYRLYCARKGMKVKEAVLDDVDVSKALLEYINDNHITNIIVGASNRNAITRKFRTPDVPTTLLKSSPEFSNVYVIWKGKTLTVRNATNQLSNVIPRSSFTASSPRHSSFGGSTDHDESSRSNFRQMKGGRKATPIPTPDRRSIDRNPADYIRTPRSRDRTLATAKTVPSNLTNDNLVDTSARMQRRASVRRDSFSDDFDFQGSIGFHSIDFDNALEFSSFTLESPRGPSSPMGISRDLEAEMKRLKLELKQTMDMYSTACKEAISAKQKAKELHQWKLEETRRIEQARQAEEAALEIAEMEKARSKAAIEAAQTAQKIAELEARKRMNAELTAKREAEEKKRALDALAQNDVRYRKYTIEEIESATGHFSESLKVGEGGYGPVYRATLDHTAVAIKVLRPDAVQGRRQFQQEVEVLSLIRHPNMVLLLGACPEYGCLVYEYMDYGSLDDRLFRRNNTPPIPWSTRFKIAAEIATGLLFLHQAKPEPLVHRDLKPGNILLDHNYMCKISDVGLARLVPPTVADTVTQYRMTSTAGTFCYIDPEYQQTGMLGIKSDIYSLGVLLLQIITARNPMGLTHHVDRAIERGTFQEMLDPAIKDWPLEEALSFAKLALKCAELRRKDRPDLRRVILPELNRLRSFGRAYEHGRLGDGGGGWGSLSGRFGSNPPPPRPWSQVNQERFRSIQRLRSQASDYDEIKTSESSPSSGK